MREVEEDIWKQVEVVLASKVSLALATTGGGSELVSWLLDHPGASRAVVEAQIPYHPAALQDYLGASGPHRVEARTALQLAGQAYLRARQLTGQEGRAVGLGATAALATDRIRRGEDRAWVALRLEGEYRLLYLHFARGAADRLEQEEWLSRLALEALVSACGGTSGQVRERPAYLTVSQRSLSLAEPLDLLFQNELEVVEVDPEGRVQAEVERRDRVLFPGSFNPLHPGHVQLAAVAQQLSGRQVCLELSVENVDKPPLSRSELDRRLEQFRGRYRAVVTRAPTFLLKARLFNRCTFVVGCDTAVRLLDPQYYREGEEGMRQALAEIEAAGCRFLVAGRLHQGTYQTLEDIELPKFCRKMFTAIPESLFRVDLSSTEIRSGRESG